MDWTDSGFGVMLKSGVKTIMLGVRRRGRGSGRERVTGEMAGEAALKRRLLIKKIISIILERGAEITTSDSSVGDWLKE